MSDWEVLGIGPTRDPKELKRAYNRKLREHPPEKDPVGFMRLRAAYERLQEELERTPTTEETVEEDFGSDPGDDPDASDQWDESDDSSCETEEDHGLERRLSQWRIPGRPPQGGDEGEGTGNRWSHPPPPETSLVPPGGSGGSGFGRKPDHPLGDPPEDRKRRTLFQDRPEGYGGAARMGPAAGPSSRGFSPGSAKDVTSPGDHEVNPLWLAFRELWITHRDDPDHGAWQDLIELLETDRTFRSLFGPRLARFLEDCFATGEWQGASPVLLWRLAVVLGWDRDPTGIEEILGRSIGSFVGDWRIAAAMDSLVLRFRALAEDKGWRRCGAWVDFFALLNSDPGLRRAFEPVGRKLLLQGTRMGVSRESPQWIERKLDELARANARTIDRTRSLPPAGPSSTVRFGGDPVENLQPQDRSIVWAMLLLGLAMLGFLGYLVAKRILGG